MRIELDHLSKHFDKTWIFKELSLGLTTGDRLAVLGGNGSGKSTFLKVAAGFMSASSGKINIFDENAVSIPADQLYRHIAIAAPYLQLLEDLTVADLLKQQSRFMNWDKGLTTQDVPALCWLEGQENKPVKNLSSGMKQRLKLGLSILTDRPFLLLDEPASNLDKAGSEWFRQLLDKHSENKIVVICSNQPEIEAQKPTLTINIEDYKSSAR